MSLRFRLNLMIALTLLIIVGVGTLFVVHNARRSVLEEVRSSVNMALQWVDAGVARSEGRQHALLAWLGELAKMEKIRHLHLHMRQPPQSMIDLSQDASKQAISPAPAWFVWAVTPALTVGERQLTSNDGEPVHIFIEANPADEIAEAWIEARSFLIFMLALAAAVSALVHISLGRAFNSVGHILRGMEDIEQGDYGKRLPRFDLQEFDRISAAFNQMARTLAKSRDENRILTRHSLRVQEEGRRFLAQELHDELGQSLSAIKALAASLRNAPLAALKLQNVARMKRSGMRDNGTALTGITPRSIRATPTDTPLANTQAAQTIMDQCDRLFGVVRGMMRRLHPLMLDELGLIPSLQDMIENWRTRHPGISIHCSLDEDVEEFVGSAKIHLFRIVQESLTNITKHAGAGTVQIKLDLREDDCIHLTVADDGKGFDPVLPRTGFGLHGIYERVASMDGFLTLQTAPGRGVSLTIKIPCVTNQH
ncbi:MAG: ATP-binding protein [Proteobacteria bacterium]|nr:ATP-binding protein [Pseudomonadota bacterium]